MLKKPAKKKKASGKRPRQEHPFLVGCSHREAYMLARGATALGLRGPVTLLREAALDAARDALGLKPGEF